MNQSAGGLVSALSGVGNNYEMLWVGWPGVFVEEGSERDALTKLLLRRGCLPIYLSRSEVDLYYNGYCNNILWPLFHYVPLSFESKLSETKNMALQWAAYQNANEAFARVIAKYVCKAFPNSADSGCVQHITDTLFYLS